VDGVGPRQEDAIGIVMVAAFRPIARHRRPRPAIRPTRCSASRWEVGVALQKSLAVHVGLGVTTGKAQTEHKFSGLPPGADIREACRHFRVVP
jgi:hypothetical protein